MDFSHPIFIQWLKTAVNDQQYIIQRVEPLAGDAGFRRYARVYVQKDSVNSTFIVVISPPQLEKNARFISIALMLRQSGINASHILATELVLGFFLLKDMSSTHLQDVLKPNTIDMHYYPLFELLGSFYSLPQDKVNALGQYDYDILLHEMGLFKDWFVSEFLQLSLDESTDFVLKNTQHFIAYQCNLQPKVFVHRDFHCRNIMVCDDGYGVIDFQDALHGPYTYDFVSLVKDCYTVSPDEKIKKWMLQFYRQCVVHNIKQPIEINQFITDVTIMGLQRHIKVLGIFCRLYLRDGKSRYLCDLPTVYQYVVQAALSLPETREFGLWLKSLAEIFTQRLYSLIGMP